MTVAGGPLRATTGTDGRYRIESVPTGTVKITARAIGHRAETRTDTVRAGQVTRVNFFLKPVSMRLDEVIVAAENRMPSSRARKLGFADGGIGLRGASRSDFNTEEYKRIYDNAWRAPTSRECWPGLRRSSATTR